MNQRKAIALFSGGLDSRLAILLVARQNVPVTVLHFITGFEHEKEREAKHLSRVSFCVEYGLEYHEVPIQEEFLGIIEDPRHGWGKNLNPCIDCKILMLHRARAYMGQIGADFVVTGEVLGQRPMSQHGPTLRLIEKESGLEGLLLRPLSARVLPPTIPEERGWIDREQLEGISGRSRKQQMRLAREFGLEDYPPPAGGCLLTDPRFSDKLRDMLSRGPLNRHEVELLKVGRHFRLSDRAKLVMARDEREAKFLLEQVVPEDWMFYPENNKGPLAVGRGNFSKDDTLTAARAVGYYSRFPEGEPRVVMTGPGAEKHQIIVIPLSEEEIEAMRL